MEKVESRIPRCEKYPGKSIQEVITTFGGEECNSCEHFLSDDYGAFYCNLIGNSFTDFMSKGV